MKTTNEITQTLPLLIEIARRAIELDRHEFEQKVQRHALEDGYEDWKQARSIQRVEFDTPEWEAMKAATDDQFAEFQRAKRRTYNAKRRLHTAIALLNSRGGRA